MHPVGAPASECSTLRPIKFEPCSSAILDSLVIRHSAKKKEKGRKGIKIRGTFRGPEKEIEREERDRGREGEINPETIIQRRAVGTS